MQISNNIKKYISSKWGPLTVVMVFLMLVPLFITDGYVIRVINTIFLYSIIAVSINLIGGYGGHLAMGHACYVGIAAYTTAILSTNFGMPFIVTFPLSVIMATIYGFLTSIICVGRIKGDYVMIVTMGVSEITRIFFVNLVGVTNGPMGIAQIPPVSIFFYKFTSSSDYYYLFLFFLIITIIVIRNIVNSKFGRAIIAIREDEIAAKAMGIRVNWNKIITFTITALFAGMAGALFAHYNRFVGPMQFDLDEGLLYFQMIILGGLGSIPGSILGASIFVLIPEVFRGISVYRTIVYGLIMVVMMIVRPQGILGNVGDKHILVRYSNSIKSFVRNKKKLRGEDQ